MDLRALVGSVVQFLRQRRAMINAILATAALVGGLSLAVLSFIPEIKVVGSETLQGTVNATSRVNLSFVRSADLVELRLDVGNCSIFVTALDVAQWDAYVSTGDLPSPQIGCASPNVGLAFPLRALVVENRGPQTEAYAIAARLFTVRETQAYLAIAALPLVLAGGIYLALQGLRRGVQRIREDLLLEVRKR